MDISQIIERVEKASGPDRELDYSLVKLFDEAQFSWCQKEYELMLAECQIAGREEAIRRSAFGGCPHYTSSLDAVMGLIERRLPETTGWHIHRVPTNHPPRALADVLPPGLLRYSAEHQNPVIALLAAALRAIQANEKESG